MKRLVGSLVIMMAVVALASVSFASDHGKLGSQMKATTSEEICVANVIGPVLSIDKATNRIVVRDQSDRQNKVITVNPNEVSRLKVGDVVRFQLSASPLAQEVEVMKLDTSKKGK